MLRERGAGAVHEHMLCLAAVDRVRECLSEAVPGTIFSLGPNFQHGRDAVFQSLRLFDGKYPRTRQHIVRNASGFAFLPAGALAAQTEAAGPGHHQSVPGNVQQVHFFYKVADNPGSARVAPFVRKAASSHIAVAEVLPLSCDHQARRLLVHAEDPQGTGFVQFQMLDSGPDSNKSVTEKEQT